MERDDGQVVSATAAAIAPVARRGLLPAAGFRAGRRAGGESGSRGVGPPANRDPRADRPYPIRRSPRDRGRRALPPRGVQRRRAPSTADGLAGAGPRLPARRDAHRQAPRDRATTPSRLMAFRGIVEAFEALPAFRRLAEGLPSARRRLTVAGLAGSSDAVLVAGLARRLSHRLLRRRHRYGGRRRALARRPAGADRRRGVALYPPREGFGEVEPHAEIAGERVETLERADPRGVRVLLTTGARRAWSGPACRARCGGSRLELRRGDVRRPEELAAHLERDRLRARADGGRRRAVLGARRHLRHLLVRHGGSRPPGVLGRRDRRPAALRPGHAAIDAAAPRWRSCCRSTRLPSDDAGDGAALRSCELLPPDTRGRAA